MVNASNFDMGSSLMQSSARLTPDQKVDFDFYITNYCKHSNEKGSLYTWGSGEMGQLGYSSRIIGQMPKDRDGYPFQVSQSFFL